MVAMAVLAIGGLATLQLVGVLTTSNKSVSATTDALGLANRLVSEISNARYLSPLDQDPGLRVNSYSVNNPPCGPYPQALTAPCGSVIRTVGHFVPANFNPVPANANPAYTVSYIVRPCAICLDPLNNGTNRGMSGVEILVTVDNFRNPGPLLKPLRMVLRKEYTASASPGRVRY
jgi:hypothetical protein